MNGEGTIVMGSKRRPEAMIFDLDGTLFQTETLLLPAYHATFAQLRAEGKYNGETPPEQHILGALGMMVEHIWREVMPEADESVLRRAEELLTAYQLEGLARGEGALYDDVADTLKELSALGIRLFVASNGLEPYVRGVIRSQGLEPLFEEEGLYSAGQYRTRSKVDLVKLLLEKHGITEAWMVGDRSSDVEAGHRNGLFTVGCDYASFGKPGELDRADARIESFRQLLDWIEP